MLEHRFLKLAVFILYWLGFAPWLVLVLQRLHLLNAMKYTDLFLQYTTVFFVLLLIYIVIHQVFEYFYLRRKIKKVVRRVTIRRQLERFEKGEIDLVAAQRISTFTKLKPPKRLQKKKRKSLSVKRKEQRAMPVENQPTLEEKKNNEKNISEALSPEKEITKELEKQDNENVKEAVKSPSCVEVVVVENQPTLEEKKNNEKNISEALSPEKEITKELEKQDNENVKEAVKSPSCVEVVVVEK